ncbi:MAG: hypothetical protein EBV25_01475, partial [Methylophilaceae bacterium]|nr:hypothetical protein [Methylophilaceae bacterium]
MNGDMMNKPKLSSYLIIFMLVGIVLTMHMAPAALIAMLIYLLTKRLGDCFQKYLSEIWAR